MLTELFGAAHLAGLTEALGNGVRWHASADAAIAGRFTALAPEAALRRTLVAERILAGRIRVVRNNRAIPIEMMMERQDGGWRLSPAALHGLTGQGVSLSLLELDRQFPAIGALSALLERRFRVKSWTNAYWSHGTDSAFKPHSDNHDVLVLHVSGRKRWRFWGAIEPSPVVSRPYEAESLGPPQDERIVCPGDLLYVPRGDVHCAALETGSSFHLTVALERPRVDHVLKGLEALAFEAEPMRQDLPADPADADRVARERLAQLLGGLPPGALSRPFGRALQPRTVVNLGVVPGPDTLLVPVLRDAPRHQRQPDGTVLVSASGLRLRLEAPEWLALQRALEADALRFGELGEALRPAARQLVGRGLLYALEAAEWRA